MVEPKTSQEPNTKQVSVPVGARRCPSVDGGIFVFFGFFLDSPLVDFGGFFSSLVLFFVSSAPIGGWWIFLVLSMPSWCSSQLSVPWAGSRCHGHREFGEIFVFPMFLCHRCLLELASCMHAARMAMDACHRRCLSMAGLILFCRVRLI